MGFLTGSSRSTSARAISSSRSFWRFRRTIVFPLSSITTRRMAAHRFRCSNRELFCFTSRKRPESSSRTTFAAGLTSCNGCSGRWAVLDRWLARIITSASTRPKNFPTRSIATSRRRTVSMACSTNNSRTGRLSRATTQLRTWRSYPWIVPWKRQAQNLDDFPHLKRWFETIRARPATVRAYQKADQINTQPTVSAESKSVLFGQTAATVAG